MQDTYLKDILEKSLIPEPYISTSKKKKFYVSDSGKCHRMRFLKRLGVESETDPENIHWNWTLSMGNLIHEYVYEKLTAQGILVNNEGTVENDHFKGKFDAIVKDGEGGKILVDIKSANPYKIKYLEKGETDEFTRKQILTYWLMLREEGVTDLKKATGVYVNKLPSQRSSNTVFYTRDWYLTEAIEKELKEEMEELVQYWEAKEIPEPTPQPDWMKDYNSFEPFNHMKADEIKKWLDVVEGTDKQLVTSNKSLYLLHPDGKKTIIIKKN